jgi:hypothetical protein
MRERKDQEIFGIEEEFDIYYCLELAQRAQAHLADKYRWEHSSYDFDPSVKETVLEHEKEMERLAEEMFLRFPFDGVDLSTYLQTVLLIRLHDLDEWKHGDVSVNTQNHMSDDEKKARVYQKKVDFEEIIEEYGFPKEMSELYDAFEGRHDGFSVPSWASPIAIATTGLIDKVQGRDFMVKHSRTLNLDGLLVSNAKIEKEFDLLTKALPPTGRNITLSKDLRHWVNLEERASTV